MSRGSGSARGLVEERIEYGPDPAQQVLIARSERLAAGMLTVSGVLRTARSSWPTPTLITPT